MIILIYKASSLVSTCRPFSNLPLIILFFVLLKFFINLVFNFSWDLRQIENNAYAKFWRDKEEYYGKFENGLLNIFYSTTGCVASMTK